MNFIKWFLGQYDPTRYDYSKCGLCRNLKLTSPCDECKIKKENKK